MNKINILSAPIYALFSREFYRQVLKAPLSRGFLYLLYLSTLLTVFFYGVILMVGIPQLDSLVDWIKADMPPIVATSQGLQMSTPSPHLMVHPDFGPLVALDMRTAEVEPRSMVDAPPLVVTSTKVYIRSGQGPEEYRAIDLFPDRGPQGGTQIMRSVRVDGEVIEKIYTTLKFWVLLLLFLVLIPIFYLMYLLHGLMYSLVGLLVNMMRSSKLNYSAILNVSFFALTAAVFYGILRESVPFLNFLPGGFWISLLITGVYLFVFTKPDEEKSV
jgi:hypothetical protein